MNNLVWDAILVAGGIVLGHFVPDAYTWLFKREQEVQKKVGL